MKPSMGRLGEGFLLNNFIIGYTRASALTHSTREAIIGTRTYPHHNAADKEESAWGSERRAGGKIEPKRLQTHSWNVNNSLFVSNMKKSEG